MKKKLDSPDMLMLIVAFIWCFNTFFLKLIFESMSAYVFTGLRFFLIVLLNLLFFLHVKSIKLIFKVKMKDILWFFWAGFFAFFTYQVCMIEGLNRTPLFLASVLLSMSPLFGLLLSQILGMEKNSIWTWFGVIISFVGIVIFKYDKAEMNLFTGNFTGELFCLGSALSWALYSIIAKKELFQQYHPAHFTLLCSMVGCVFLATYTYSDMKNFDYISISGTSWLMIFYTVAFGIVIAYRLYQNALVKMGIERTIIYIYLVPILVGIVSIIAGKEPFSWLKFLGAAVVIAGMILAKGNPYKFKS